MNNSILVLTSILSGFATVVSLTILGRAKSRLIEIFKSFKKDGTVASPEKSFTVIGPIANPRDILDAFSKIPLKNIESFFYSSQITAGLYSRIKLFSFLSGLLAIIFFASTIVFFAV